jgi:hypothetical protein
MFSDRDQLVSCRVSRSLQSFLDVTDGDGPTGELSIGVNPPQRPFQLTDIGTDALGDKKRHLIGESRSRLFGLALENRHPGFQFRRFDRDGQARTKAGFQAVFQTINFLGIAVASQR